jgi:signal peptidase I
MKEGVLKKGDVVKFKVNGYSTHDVFKKEYLVEEVITVIDGNKKFEQLKLEGYLMGLVHPNHLELVSSSPKFKKGDVVKFTETAKKIMGTDDDEHIIDSCDTIVVARWNK